MGWNKLKQKLINSKYYSYHTDNGVLLCGDCLEVMKEFPEKSVDLIVTSPPYDTLRFYSTKDEKELEKIWNFEKFKYISKELYKITKEGGVVVWVVGDATINGSETGNSFRQALYFKDECGFNLHDTMIYLKHGFAFPSNNRYHQVFEYMFVLSKGRIKCFNPIKDRKNRYRKRGGGCNRQKDGSMKEGNRGGLPLQDYGQRYNVWSYKIGGGHVTKDKIAYQHPAIFPEQLAHDHIISWSNEEDVILDPLCGSGTTLKMAENLNRRWIGIEISEEYCELSKERIKREVSQKRLF